MREAVIRCFDRNEGWLTGVFEQAEAEGSLRVDGSPREARPGLLLGFVRIAADAAAVPKEAGLARRCGS